LAPLVQAGGRVAGDRVPADHQGLDEERERDGALYVDAKSVVSVIETIFPLEEIAAAHRSLEKSGEFGKRVVQVA
jgi:NADPH:quinone reductase-like Zn-dependent oxidoreductase